MAFQASKIDLSMTGLIQKACSYYQVRRTPRAPAEKHPTHGAVNHINAGAKAILINICILLSARPSHPIYKLSFSAAAEPHPPEHGTVPVEAELIQKLHCCHCKNHPAQSLLHRLSPNGLHHLRLQDPHLNLSPFSVRYRSPTCYRHPLLLVMSVGFLPSSTHCSPLDHLSKLSLSSFQPQPTHPPSIFSNGALRFPSSRGPPFPAPFHGCPVRVPCLPDQNPLVPPSCPPTTSPSSRPHLELGEMPAWLSLKQAEQSLLQLIPLQPHTALLLHCLYWCLHLCSEQSISPTKGFRQC